MSFLPPNADFDSQPAVCPPKTATVVVAPIPRPRRKDAVRAWWALAISLTLWTLFAAQATAQTYQWSTLAGPDGGIGFVDGVGSEAGFCYPRSVAVDASGNVYVADTNSHVIRKITSGGSVSTFAGRAQAWGSTDGVGSAARFNLPSGVAVDGSGNVYVADSNNNAIRKITSGGSVSTLAGNVLSSGSANGVGSAAQFNYPTGVAVDGSGNAFVADRNNHVIRQITSGGSVSTLAGTPLSSGSANGVGSAARFYFPSGVAVDVSGNVYVADYQNCVIRKIASGGSVSTLAGTVGFSGTTNGVGSAARFSYPYGVAVDGSGTLYVADSANNTIRQITSGGSVSTFAGTAQVSGSTDGVAGAARFTYPSGVAVDGSGNVFVADSNNSVIRKITSGGSVSTLAGTPISTGSLNGTGSAARFNFPFGVAVDGLGNVFVADKNNHLIRQITSGGSVSTLAGTALSSGSANGVGSAAKFNYPYGVAVDGSGNVFVADTNNHVIRQITSGGSVSTLAGTALVSGSVNGVGSAARFNYPQGVSVDALGKVCVADTNNFVIRQITSGGSVSTLAGTALVSGSANGVGSAAGFNAPQGVSVDALGNVLVADKNNHVIRQITSGGSVSTLAGTALVAGSANGVASAAKFNYPNGVAVDGAGNVYVADTVNHVIRKITARGSVSTLGGMDRIAGWKNGTGSTALFASPRSIAVDATGTLYVTGDNNNVRMGVPLPFAPVIDVQPLSLSLIPGSSAVFSVNANGTAPLTYQWRKGGVPIIGGTSATLMLPAVELGDAAAYDVVVTNSLGSTPSDPAVLTVVPLITTSDVSFAQRTDGSKLVDVYYTLSGGTSGVGLLLSLDGGTSFTSMATLTGDVGSAISSGTAKHIVWNAGADYVNSGTATVKMRVTPLLDGVVGAFAPIPGGTYSMGNLAGDSDITNAGTVSVTLSPYYLAVNDTTKAQWDTVRTWAASNGYTDLALGAGKASNHPVQMVSWHDVVKWANAASEKEGLTPCYKVGGVVVKTGTSDSVVCDWSANGYRLPTEAEWEIAARGGLSGKRFPWGNTISQSQANYKASTGNTYDLSGAVNGYHPTYNTGAHPYTSPVASFLANGYGLYDVAGNVWQWCWDWYGTYAGGSDPRGGATGIARANRGASYVNDASYPRSAFRDSAAPSNAYGNYGFRLARIRPSGTSIGTPSSAGLLDTTPPVLTPPANMIVSATSASGATVTLSGASATDNVGTPTIAYSPVSGGTFAVGTTTVTATATDAMGNTASGTFSVTVTPFITTSDVSFAQRTDGSKLVDVYYTLDGGTSSVGLLVSLDGGTSFTSMATLTGDVGSAISAGTAKHIVWDAGADYVNSGTSKVKMRVTPLLDGAGGAFAPIPGGTYAMGNLIGDSDITNAGTVSVTLSPYYMAVNDTTKAQWDTVRTWAASNGYTDLRAGAGKASNHPVQMVSWYDAVKWANAASEKEGLTACYKVGGAVVKTGTSDAVVCDWTANGYRLPTEAEWEIAARGGLSGKRFPWGDTISQTQANYQASTSYAYDLSGAVNNYHPTYATGAMPYTSPVGSFAPNGYGLYDMAGNVYQWCWDWFGTPYTGGTDPQGPASGTYRTHRGGAWDNPANTRSARRGSSLVPSFVNTAMGFRLARGRPVSASNGATSTAGVVDTTPPVLSLPADLTVYGTSVSGATVTLNGASATDNVGTPALTYSPVSGGTFAVGVTTVTATATDSVGNTASGTFTVTVTPPLLITTQPVSRTVTVGSSATFMVVASGPAPLTYQWRKGGTNLSGGTSASFAILSAQPFHEGSYDVVVTNPGGSVTSDVATLTVDSPFNVQVLTGSYGASFFKGSNAFQSAVISRLGDDGTSSWSYALLSSSGTGAALASGTLGQNAQISIPLRAVTASGEYMVRVTRTSAGGSTTSIYSNPFRLTPRTWVDAAGSYELMLEDANGAIGDQAHYRGKVTATLNSTGAVSGRLLYNAAPHLEAANPALSPEWSVRAYSPVARAFTGVFATGADGEPQAVRAPKIGAVATGGSQVLTLNVDFSTTPLQLKAAVQDYESVQSNSSFPNGAMSSGSSSAVLTNLRSVPLAGGTQVVDLSSASAVRYALASDATAGGSLGAGADNNAYLLAQALPTGNMLWATRLTGYSGSGSGGLRLQDVAGGTRLGASFYEAQSVSSAVLLQTTSLLGELQLSRSLASGTWAMRVYNGGIADGLERQSSYLGKGLVNGKLAPVYTAATFKAGSRPVARDGTWSRVGLVDFGDQNASAWSLATGVFGAFPALTRKEHYLSALDPVSGGKYIWKLSISSAGAVRTWKHKPGDASQPFLGLTLDRARGEFLGEYLGLDGLRRNLRGVVLPQWESRDPSAQGWLETGVLPGMQTGGWWLSE